MMRASKLVLAGLVAAVGAWAAGLVLHATSPQAPAASDPFGVAAFDCSQIRQLGVDRQLNLRAAAILRRCLGGRGDSGVEALPPPEPESLSPTGGGDVNLITGGEVSPHVTQDSPVSWSHGDTVVVTYNDTKNVNGSPLSVCGASRSTDGGATFTRLAETFSAPTGCYGEMSVFYSVKAGKWVILTLAPNCGGGGVDTWTSTDGGTWTAGPCAFSGVSADGPSGWVDNIPASPFYGTQYVFFNDFNVSSGVPRVTRSTDNGATWSAPSNVAGTFLRAEQVTGSSFDATGTTYFELMDEGGGGFNTRTRSLAKSTDGGLTFSVTAGGSFPAPGRGICGYFAGMYTTPTAGYWRYMGWGQLAVGPGGILHYAYSAHGASTDPGDIYYVRSTDTGATWSVPVKLNSDATALAQWLPALTVSSQGRVMVTWYDERNQAAPDQLQRFGRLSPNQGLTWQADAAVSDVVFPKPLQPDPNYQTCAVGFLGDRAAASDDGRGTSSYHPWTDGRVFINAAPQQDVFFDTLNVAREPAEFDLDGLSDFAVFRPSSADWYLNGSQLGFIGVHWGVSTDRIVPGDYDGDARMDLGVYRDGAWYVLRASGVMTGATFGLDGDIPVPGDFDGDGKSDLAVFRPSTGTWYLQQSTAGFFARQFGTAGDRPLQVDFDGDAKNDIAVFRPSTGTWYWILSSTGQNRQMAWGQNGDVPVPGDYNGDGRTDLAVFRPSTGTWWEFLSRTNTFVSPHWGQNGDVPVPGDFDGDGKTDLAVYRSGAWWISKSSNGQTQFFQFGLAGDIPIHAAQNQ